jgi:hypothetical protein
MQGGKNEVLAGPEDVKNGHTFASAGAYLKILDRILDPRPLIFGVLTLGLCAFCLRTLIVDR